MKESSSFLTEKLLEEIKTLKAKVKSLDGLEQEVIELRAENAFLRKENAELKDKLNLNSRNSSIPSSKELYKQKRNEKKSSGRKRGGQPGHKGHYRKNQEPNEIVEVELEDKSCECGGEFCKAGDPEVQQKVDIPKIDPYIINYVLNYYQCNKCGMNKKAELPPGVTADVFGYNVKTVIAALTTFYKNSKRDVQKILRDIFNVEISLGCISNNEGRVSKKCQEAYENVESEVQNGTVVHMDETGHRKGEKKGWCWFFGTTTSSLVKLADSRGTKVLAESVFGKDDNIIVSDRYGAYNYFNEENRQICWAHLSRDFERFAGSTHEEVKLYGIYLSDISRELFALKKALLAEEIEILFFLRRVKKLRRRTLKYLNEISYIDGLKQAPGMAKQMLKSESMMWRFMYAPYEIPLTNNHAERQIRHYVVYRKNSYFTWSDRGDRYLERLISLFLTWRQRGLNPFKELNQLITA